MIPLELKFTKLILRNIVVSIFEDLNLNFTNGLGVATVGCSVMTSTLCGAVPKVQTYASHGVQCPCSTYSLKLPIF